MLKAMHNSTAPTGENKKTGAAKIPLNFVTGGGGVPGEFGIFTPSTVLMSFAERIQNKGMASLYHGRYVYDLPPIDMVEGLCWDNPAKPKFILCGADWSPERWSEISRKGSWLLGAIGWRIRWGPSDDKGYWEHNLSPVGSSPGSRDSQAIYCSARGGGARVHYMPKYSLHRFPLRPPHTSIPAKAEAPTHMTSPPGMK